MTPIPILIRYSGGVSTYKGNIAQPTTTAAELWPMVAIDAQADTPERYAMGHRKTNANISRCCLVLPKSSRALSHVLKSWKRKHW